MTSYIKYEKSSITINLWVKTNSNKQGFLGAHPKGLIFGVKALPQEGQANQAIIEMLAKFIRVPQQSIKIIKGHKSRHKTIKISSDECHQLYTKLLEHSQANLKL